MRKKTKPARNATPNQNSSDDPFFDKNFASQYEDDHWQHNAAGGAEKREAKKKPKMPVSGQSVLKLQKIILRKTLINKAN